MSYVTCTECGELVPEETTGAACQACLGFESRKETKTTICRSCQGVNGHRDPFCPELDLKGILNEPEETSWHPAIQIVETVKDREEAEIVLAGLRIQTGHIASRILEPTYYEPLRVQAIIETNGDSMQGWLPDGMKHVTWRGRF